MVTGTLFQGLSIDTTLRLIQSGRTVPFKPPEEKHRNLWFSPCMSKHQFVLFHKCRQSYKNHMKLIGTGT